MKSKTLLLSWFPLVAAVIILGIASIVIYQNHKYIMEQQEDLISSYENKLNSKQEKLETLYNRLTKILTPDELLERDMNLFIKIINSTLKDETVNKISSTIIKLSRKHQISPQVILAVMKVESSFNQNAVGPKTKYGNARARGLMQVMPEWVKKIDCIETKEDLFDIEKGIEAGIIVLKIHIEECHGSLSKALYYYVNKDITYSTKVYETIGKFTAFRSTISVDNEMYMNDLTTILESELKEKEEVICYVSK